jgi:hypothetical protein
LQETANALFFVSRKYGTKGNTEVTNMNRANYFLCIFLLLSTITFAQDLVLKIVPESTKVSVGLPVTFKLALNSETPFTLHGTFGVCNEHLVFEITDQSGQPADFTFGHSCPPPDLSGFDSRGKMQYEGNVIKDVAMYLEVGTYTITALYHSKGPYLDRYSPTDQRPVEGIWLGELVSNTIRVTVSSPQGPDQSAWSDLAEPTNSLESIASFLENNSDEIVEKYPKSTYAAWLMWVSGNSYFAEIKHDSADKDFTFKLSVEEQEKTVPGSIEHYKKITDGIVSNWKPLYDGFPNFVHRDKLLLGLAQTYFVIGEPQSAISLIKELQQRFPESEMAKQSIAYRKVLIAKEIWKD